MGSGFERAIVEGMETTGVEQREYSDGPRIKRTRQVHPRSDFSQVPWSTILKKAELNRHDSREARNLRRRFRIPYEFFLALVKLAKQVALIGYWLLAIGCNGRNREAEHTSGAESVEVVANSAKNSM